MKKSEVVHDLTMIALEYRIQNNPDLEKLLATSGNRGLQILSSLYIDIYEKIYSQPSLYNQTAIEKD